MITLGESRGFSLPDDGGSPKMDERRQAVHEASLSVKERACFDALYRKQYEAVLQVIRGRVGCEHEAADLAQEAFLRVMRYRSCAAESLKFLLFRIALNLAVSHSRLARVRCDQTLGDWDLAADLPTIDDQLVVQEQRQQILAAVDSLPGRCRDAFVLSRFYGIRQHEIAARYGISRRMVELHIARAQALIRERCA